MPRSTSGRSSQPASGSFSTWWRIPTSGPHSLEQGQPVGHAGIGQVDPSDDAADEPARIRRGRQELLGLGVRGHGLHQDGSLRPGHLAQVGRRVRAADRVHGRAGHPRVVAAGRIPQVVVRVDHGCRPGTGTSARSSPSALRSAHSASGTGIGEPVGVLLDLGRRLGTEHEAVHDRVRGGQRDRGVRQLDAVPRADRGDPLRAGHELGGRGRVVVGRAGHRGGEDAGVEHAGRQHGDAPLGTQRQQLVQRRLLEQRVPPGDQHHVHVGPADELGERGDDVHAEPDPAEHALVAQLGERRQGAVERLGDVVLRVVHERDVDPVGPQPAEAGLQAAQRAVPAVVAAARERRRHVEALGVALPRAAGVVHEQPADLGGQHVVVARAAGEGGAEAAFGQAEAVVRGGVEVADAAGPRGVHDRPRVLAGHGPEEVAQLGAAEAERGEVHGSSQTRRRPVSAPE